MRQQGRLTTWHDDRGFGFITPNGGGPFVFVHRKDWPVGRRPRGEELLTYELSVDARGRHNARRVQYVGATGRRTLPAVGAIVAPALALVFFAYLAGATLQGRLHWLAPAWYLLLSIVIYFAYQADKTAAMRRMRRTPEIWLHSVSLLGGWPGALIAQRWLRHKSSKVSFLITFGISVAANVSALVWLQRSNLLSRLG